MAFYTKIKVILTVILAITISIAAYIYLKGLREEVTVIIADKDIEARVWVTDDMLKEINIRKADKNILAPDSIASLKDMNLAISKIKIPKGKVIDKDDVIRGTKRSLIENKVINENNTINTAYFIANSKRIMTVRVDSQGAVLNKLKTGDYVDVVLTAGNDAVGSFSTIILQHIAVNDVEKITEKGGNASQNISLEVTPQEAVDLTFAKRNGKIDLLLNPLQGEVEIIYPTSINKFIDPFTKEESNSKDDETKNGDK